MVDERTRCGVEELISNNVISLDVRVLIFEKGIGCDFTKFL